MKKAPRAVAASCRRRPDRGLVVIVALVCLAMASVVFLAILRTSLSHRDAVRAEVGRVQAAWLAESGLERAVARLAADRSYQGETWKVPAAEFGGDDAGVVRIEVRPSPQASDRRLVRVEADFPDDPEHRARESKEIVVVY